MARLFLLLRKDLLVERILEKAEAAGDDGLLAAADDVFFAERHGLHLVVGDVHALRDALDGVHVHPAEVEIGVAVIDDGAGLAVAVQRSKLGFRLQQHGDADALLAQDGDLGVEIGNIRSCVASNESARSCTELVLPTTFDATSGSWIITLLCGRMKRWPRGAVAKSRAPML